MKIFVSYVYGIPSGFGFANCILTVKRLKTNEDFTKIAEVITSELRKKENCKEAKDVVVINWIKL